MKKILLSLLAISLMLVAGNMSKSKMVMKDYRAVPASKAIILQKGKKKEFCSFCGMSLLMTYRTNHVDKVNGNMHQYCSIHDMIEAAMKSGKKMVDPEVVNNTTLKFIDANKAFYAVGSSKPATMSMVSKYAFGTKSAAKKFAKKFGGKIMRFKEVEKMVKANIKKELKMAKMSM